MNQEFNPYTNPQDNENPNPYTPPQFQFQSPKPINFFETFSWIFAIVAVLSCVYFYISYICGALAIVFALLSRGGQMQMSTKSKLGLIIGIFAIILSTAITIGAVYYAIDQYGSIENLFREYCNMYGLDFEELYGDIF